MERFIEILNSGNSDDLKDILLYFGSYENFFKFLIKRNLIDEVDMESANFGEWGEHIIPILIKTDKSILLPVINYYLEDIEFVGEDVYVFTNDLEDFINSISADYRNCASVRYVAAYLVGDTPDFFETGLDDTTEEAIEVVGDLNKSNLEYLKKIMITKLQEVSVDPSTEVLYYIADQQNNEFPKINEENIDLVIRDKRTLEYLFDYDLSELGENLSNLYKSSYDSAMADEIYNDIIDDLSEYFTDFEEIRHGVYRFKVVDFWYWFERFVIYEMRYYMSYVGTLSSTMERSICFNFPDYPDSRNIKSIINDYFTSEIG